MPSPTLKINQPDHELFAALEVLADAVAQRIVERLRAGTSPELTDQHGSPLGPRKHCAAVRRRIAEKAGGAETVGRRMMLTPEALTEELERCRRKPQGSKHSRDTGADTAQLASELGLKLVHGGSRSGV